MKILRDYIHLDHRCHVTLMTKYRHVNFNIRSFTIHLRNRSTLRFTKTYTAAYEIYGLLRAPRVVLVQP